MNAKKNVIGKWNEYAQHFLLGNIFYDKICNIIIFEPKTYVNPLNCMHNHFKGGIQSCIVSLYNFIENGEHPNNSLLTNYQNKKFMGLNNDISLCDLCVIGYFKKYNIHEYFKKLKNEYCLNNIKSISFKPNYKLINFLKIFGGYGCVCEYFENYMELFNILVEMLIYYLKIDMNKIDSIKCDGMFELCDFKIINDQICGIYGYEFNLLMIIECLLHLSHFIKCGQIIMLYYKYDLFNVILAFISKLDGYITLPHNKILINHYFDYDSKTVTDEYRSKRRLYVFAKLYDIFHINITRYRFKDWIKCRPYLHKWFKAFQISQIKRLQRTDTDNFTLLDKINRISDLWWFPEHYDASKLYYQTKRYKKHFIKFNNRCGNYKCKYNSVENNKIGFRMCNGCGLVRYCSRKCQKYHWNKIHRNHCLKSYQKIYFVPMGAYY